MNPDAKWAGGQRPPEQDRPPGWGRTVLMDRQHYFRKTRSLCGSWVYTGPTTPEPEQGRPLCPSCASARARERAK